MVSTVSIELYKILEKRALEVGIRKERFDEFSTYVLETAIKRVNEIPNCYDRLIKDAIAIGIENGMTEKNAKKMATSFVNNKRIKDVVESRVIDEYCVGDILWLNDQTKLYAKIYAESQNEIVAKKSYHLANFS